jgi:DHA1 family inner membrane transport protein
VGRTLIIGSIGIAAALVVLHAVGSFAWLAALALLAWGLSHYSIVPSLQVRVISLAGPGGQLAQSLPVSAANIGIAFGAFIGGIAIDRYDAPATVITGLILAVITIAGWARPDLPSCGPGTSRRWRRSSPATARSTWAASCWPSTAATTSRRRTTSRDA